MSKTWDDIHAQRQWGRWPNEHLIRFVMKHYGRVPKRADAWFLELGCGAGANMRFLAEEGFTVVGIDESLNACQRAGKLLEPLPRWALVNLPVQKEVDWKNIDCVIDVCCLQHLSDQDAEQAIQRTLTFLKPGGRFFSVMAASAVKAEIQPVIRFDQQVHGFFKGFEEVKINLATYQADELVMHWIVEARKHEPVFPVEGKDTNHPDQAVGGPPTGDPGRGLESHPPSEDLPKE